MRNVKSFVALLAAILIIPAGCGQPTKSPAGGRDHQRSAAPAQRETMTAANNPTTAAGRGEPSLEDFFRLAAWIYVDGKGGAFVEEEGKPQVEWSIDGAVGTCPTFRVEAYEPLLGSPKDFVCTLHSESTEDGTKVAYSLKANEGTFELGRTYSLLDPGSDFVIRNITSGDVVAEVAPLVPGKYLIAAGIKNLQAKTEGLAMSRFTVVEGG